MATGDRTRDHAPGDGDGETDGICGAALMVAGTQAAWAGTCEIHPIASLPVTAKAGKLHTQVTINGQDTDLELDTSALFNMMTQARAKALALPLRPAPPGYYVIGIGGPVGVKIATIESLGLPGGVLRDVEFLVGGANTGTGVIGANLLELYDAEFDFANGWYRVVKAPGCIKTNMAYWPGGQDYFTLPLDSGLNTIDHVIGSTGRRDQYHFKVMINGKAIPAEFDTGTPYSTITRHAAQHAGIDFASAEVKSVGTTRGIGGHAVHGWIVPVDSVKIGEEIIQRTHLLVVENDLGAENETQMLVGLDFMMAHHIFVSREQNLVFFTYSGGKPFRMPQVEHQNDEGKASNATP